MKPYRCPGCDHEIAAGLGHEVVVPTRAPDLPPALAHRLLVHREQRRRRAARTRAACRARTRLRCTSITGSSPRSTITDATSKRSSRAAELGLGQPLRGEPAEPLLLRRGHRLDRRAEARARPGLHLAEHDGATAAAGRGRAHRPGTASCGRAPRSPRPRTTRATRASPARRAPARIRRRESRRGLTGPCRRAPRC